MVHAAFPQTTAAQNPRWFFKSSAGLFFQDNFFCTEEMKQESSALPCQRLFSQAGIGAYPDSNGHGGEQAARGQGDYLGSRWHCSLGLNTDKRRKILEKQESE